MTGEFFQLPKETIPTLWPLIEKRLQPVIDRLNGRVTMASTFERLITGKWQCWTYWEGKECLAAITTLLSIEDSGDKTLEIVLASGDHREKWQHVAIETLKRFAKVEGCARVEMHARPGWQRIFPDFKQILVTLEWRVQ